MNSKIPPKVIIHAANPQPLVKAVLVNHPDLQIEECNTYEALPSLVKQFKPNVVFSIRFAGTPDFPAQSLLAPSGPQWIAIGGSGFDHLGQWDPSKVTVTNSAGVAADMMAEYVLGGFLHFSLDVAGLERDRLQRRWQSDRQMIPLAGKTMLIIGLGNTGKAIASRAKAFGMHVIGAKAHPDRVDFVDQVAGPNDLGGLWGRADFIVVCVPLLPATRKLVDKAAFRSMKPGVILADVSRGGIVDSDALNEALEEGIVRAAVLDVFEEEPLPESHVLWQRENLLISPHCSSVFDGWEQKTIRMFSENLTCWRSGERLQNEVKPR